MRDITWGRSFNGVKWEIDFSTIDGNRYLWQGEFENRGLELLTFQDILSAKEDTSQIIYEKLHLNDSLIVERDQDNIVFGGEKTVKLSQQKSVLNLLKEEDLIASAQQGFQKILFHDITKTYGILEFGSVDTNALKCKTLEQIQKSDAGIKTKLYLTSLVAPDTFDQIKSRFIDVFPFVEDLKIESPAEAPTRSSLPLIQIKETGIDDWIDERQISSGMTRTLLHIAQLYLCANGTVILVDEFENSLGINCIDALTGDLIGSGRDLQFIITSHHPYIINKISYEHWKLLTRKAGVVTAHDATDFNLGKSKHEAFIQLINLDQYADGVKDRK